MIVYISERRPSYGVTGSPPSKPLRDPLVLNDGRVMKLFSCCQLAVHRDTLGARTFLSAATRDGQNGLRAGLGGWITPACCGQECPRSGWAPQLTLILACLLLYGTRTKASEMVQANGWQGEAPREEIRPTFEFKPRGGPGAHELLIIRAAGREAVDGHWSRIFPIQGGQYYQFRSLRGVRNVPSPRRFTLARVLWREGSR